LTAYPAWGDPSIERGHYGDQASYVSRAYALYSAFGEADAADDPAPAKRPGAGPS
jgi:hypothetical protein